MANDEEIGLFSTKRPCQAEIDTKQLSLQDVDNITRLYFRKLLYMHDADITTSSGVNYPDEVKYSLALLLHYKQKWLPKGYGLGELVYSVSLMPNEELTLEVKTWETAKTQTEKEEDIETRNQSDVSAEQSDVSEILHDIVRKDNWHVDAKAEVKGLWGSVSAEAGYAKEVQDHHKSLNNHVQKSTQKSVNEMKKKRSIKMTVSREHGKEEKTTRTVKNINQTHTLTINYYQLLRQYKISTYLDDVGLLLLGKEFTPEIVIEIIGEEVYLPPMWEDMIRSLKEYSLDPIYPEKFQHTVLRHATPLPDITEPDFFGKHRYAFLISPDHEKELLTYLFGFYMREPIRREVKDVEKQGAPPPEVRIKVSENHFLSKVEFKDYPARMTDTVGNIVLNLKKAKSQIDQIIGKEWYTSIPTHGIYAEAMLGRCSGGEDYIEINRQFDLEIKKAEIERLKLELEKLKLVNTRMAQDSKREIVISGAQEGTVVNLNVDVQPAPEGEQTHVKFEPGEEEQNV